MTGELASVSKRIDQAAIRLYAELTDDFNPIHIDPVFASATPMKGIIAHGMLSVSLIWQSLARSLGPARAGTVLDIRFIKPVRENDFVTAGGAAVTPGCYEVWVKNQHGETVIGGTADIGVTD